MNKKVLAENLRKAERDLFICFAKGVLLYRIAEETKKKVLTEWNKEDFEVKLRAATDACTEMRNGVDDDIDFLVNHVPELRQFFRNLKEDVSQKGGKK